MFKRRTGRGSLEVAERNKLAFFFDTAVEEIDALLNYFEQKADKIAGHGSGLREEDNFPNARTTVSALRKCHSSVSAMKDGVVSGRYDLASFEERTMIIAEYLGHCDKEARVNGSDGIVGAGVAGSVLAVARERT